MFTPPRCPFASCVAHSAPESADRRFFVRNGFYHPKCRAAPVPRFRCKFCRRGFSRQTFRMDYCDNKPHLNAELFRLLASGLGLRQSARILRLSRRCTELKARKLSRHLGRLHRNLTGQFSPGAVFTMDEMETFEKHRSVLPVAVPILIESRSMYVIATDVAPIKPSGKMTSARRVAIQNEQRRSGPRQDRSAMALCRVLRRLRSHCREVPAVVVTSDCKPLYQNLLRRFFGQRVHHVRISGRRRRDQSNPMRHINLTNAMARDLNGRLRRRSWLVSKARKYLRLQLHVFAAYRNFIRRRVNREAPTPAEMLGFLPRAARFEDLLTWRQDWRSRSIHPLAQGRRPCTITQVRHRVRPDTIDPMAPR